MAIQFTKKKKKEFYLILACLFLLLLLAIFWLNFLFSNRRAGEAPVLLPSVLEQEERDIRIDFGKLEEQALGELRLFQTITPLEERQGRENPFAPTPPVEADIDSANDHVNQD